MFNQKKGDMLREYCIPGKIDRVSIEDNHICIVCYNSLNPYYNAPTLSCYWHNNNASDRHIFRILFSIDTNRDYVYNMEEFEYQVNLPDEYIGKCITDFLGLFTSCIQNAGLPNLKGARFFSVKFPDDSILRRLMPTLDKKEDGISYFIWQESK